MAPKPKSSEAYIALLRAIGPLTRKKMPMADLRAACSAAGFENVNTLLATGNIVLQTGLSLREAHARLAKVVASFGLDNAVFVRTPVELKATRDANPFPAAAQKRPNHLLVVFLAGPPDEKLLRGLGTHAGPEKILCMGREIYVDYRDGVGTSKIAPGVIERKLKILGTARNWNTIQRLIQYTDVH